MHQLAASTSATVPPGGLCLHTTVHLCKAPAGGQVRSKFSTTWQVQCKLSPTWQPGSLAGGQLSPAFAPSSLVGGQPKPWNQSSRFSSCCACSPGGTKMHAALAAPKTMPSLQQASNERCPHQLCSCVQSSAHTPRPSLARPEHTSHPSPASPYHTPDLSAAVAAREWLTDGNEASIRSFWANCMVLLFFDSCTSRCSSGVSMSCCRLQAHN